MDIAFTKTTLANGLDVILHEDHALPIVAVNVWYHVGSKNERPGPTGFAHLFEHLMFEGSAHHDHGYFPPLQDAGAAVNGSTNADRTNYWEVVPTGALELALWLESDRMGYLLPALTDKKFTNQRDVVINERRQNYENRPYGLAGIAMTPALYPPRSPVSLADHRLHRRTCAPAHARRRARLLRAPLPPGERFARARRRHRPGDGAVPWSSATSATCRPGPPVPRRGGARGAACSRETRIVLEDRVELPRLYLAWHSPALFDDGDAALDLPPTSSPAARRRGSIARWSTSSASPPTFRPGSTRASSAASSSSPPPPRPAARSTEIEAVIVDEVAASSPTTGRPPTSSRAAACRPRRNSSIGCRRVGGFSGKSDQLNAYNVYRGDPGSFDADLARYARLTADVLQAARRLARSARAWRSAWCRTGGADSGARRLRHGGGSS